MRFDHSGWQLRAGRAVAALSLAVALCSFGSGSASAQGSGCAGPDPLSRPVKALRLSQPSALAALLQLGYEYRLCFGVQSIRPDLFTKPVELEMNDATVGAVIRGLLAPAEAYAVSQEGRVILVQDAKTVGPNWLDYTVGSFKVRRADVQAVSNVLYMTLRTQADPAIRGFAGHYRPGDSGDLVGPFDELDRPVRQLLNLIVANSKGGIWIAQGPNVLRSRSLMSRPFWNILEYSQPMQLNLEMIEATAAQGRE